MDTHTHLASDHQVQLYRAASCSPVTFQLLDLLHVDLELLLQLPLVLLQLLHQLFEILQEDTEQRQKTENRNQEGSPAAAAAAVLLTRLSLVSRVISCWTLYST